MHQADLSELLRQSQKRLDDQVNRRESIAQASPGSLFQVFHQELLQGPRAHLLGLRRLMGRSSRNLRHSLSEVRDVASLDPVNPYLVSILATLLRDARPEEAHDLGAHCADRDVVLHLCCRSRLHRAWASCSSFPENASDVAHVIVVGDMKKGSPRKLDFRWDGSVLSLPVSDSYEALADKVFYAFLVLHLLTRPRLVVKVDDDLHLGDKERFQAFRDGLFHAEVAYAGHVLRGQHFQMPQGWHQGKCRRHSLHRMGYQIPFPGSYADGGFGYVLGQSGLEACFRMFMSMRAFFELDSVQLEDVFVGHAAQAAGLLLQDCFTGKSFSPKSPAVQAALPGLKRVV